MTTIKKQFGVLDSKLRLISWDVVEFESEIEYLGWERPTNYISVPLNCDLQIDKGYVYSEEDATFIPLGPKGVIPFDKDAVFAIWELAKAIEQSKLIELPDSVKKFIEGGEKHVSAR